LLLLQNKYMEAAPYFATQTDVTSRVKYALCLSYTDPLEAIQVWQRLDKDNVVSTMMTTELSGEELEQMPLPLIKSTASAAARNASSTVNLLPVAIHGTNKARRSHDSILRRRAKLREQYLASLDQQQQQQRVSGGTAEMSTTTTLTTASTNRRPPNPDRWIPKYERSKNRRRGQHKGAQGGFTEKDAAKYDVAARHAEGSAGNNNNKKSTAHMSAVAGDVARRGGGGGRRR
jgi:signal recognition particle subunit SRP72